MIMNNETSVKIIAIVSFLCTLFNLIIIINSPSSGYELSIYYSLPSIFWFFLLGSLAGGIFIIVHYSFEKKLNLVMYGFLLMIMNNFVFLSLPALRDYYLYASSDHFAHIKMANLISLNGAFDESNIYPLIHVYIVGISEICNVNILTIGKILPALLTVLYMLWIYCLCKSSFPQTDVLLLSIASSSILFLNSMNIQLYPHNSSFLLMPLVFIFYINYDKSISYKLLFILLLLIYPFFYPLSSILIIMLLASIELIKLIASDKIALSTKKYPNLIIISFVIFFMWIGSTVYFGNQIRTVINAIYEPFDNKQIIAANQTLSNIQGIDFVELFIKMYGDSILLLFFALFAAYILAKTMKNNTSSINIIVLIFLLVFPLQITLFLGSKAQTLGRFLNLNYMYTVAPILAGFGLVYIFKKAKFRVLIVTSILTLMVCISIFGVYQSPLIFQPSWHVTKMDISGTDFFRNYRNSEIEYISMGVPDLTGFSSMSTDSQAYFDHDLYQNAGESFLKNKYLLVTERNKLANQNNVVSKYKMIKGIQWEFDVNDFNMLNNDSAVYHLYANREFDLYFIKNI